MLKYKDFLIHLNEAVDDSNKDLSGIIDKLFKSKYKGKIGKHKKDIKHLRYNIGSNVEYVESQIINTIKPLVDQNSYSLTIIDPGANQSLSGTFFTFMIQLLYDTEINNTNFIAGSKVYFVNNKSTKGILTGKELSPSSLKMKMDFDYDKMTLIKDVKKKIEKYSNNPGLFEALNKLIDLAANVKPTNWFTSPELIDNFEESIEIPKDVLSVLNTLDKSDINTIGKDFGEILGALFIMNVSKYEKGIKFPKGNQALVDFLFDGYGISSKYKKGAAATLTAVAKQINTKLNNLSDTEKQLNKFLNYLVSRKYNVSDSYLQIAKDLNSPGIIKLGEILDKKYTNITKNDINDRINLAKDNNEDVLELFKDVFSLIGRSPSKINWNKIRKGREYGIIMSPLSYHVVDLLNGDIGNDKYLDALNSIIKKVEVKQLYLDFIFNVSKGVMKFNLKTFKADDSKFKFNATNISAYNPDNGNLGFKMK